MDINEHNKCIRADMVDALNKFNMEMNELKNKLIVPCAECKYDGEYLVYAIDP